MLCGVSVSRQLLARFLDEPAVWCTSKRWQQEKQQQGSSVTDGAPWGHTNCLLRAHAKRSHRMHAAHAHRRHLRVSLQLDLQSLVVASNDMCPYQDECGSAGMHMLHLCCCEFAAQMWLLLLSAAPSLLGPSCSCDCVHNDMLPLSLTKAQDKGLPTLPC